VTKGGPIIVARVNDVQPVVGNLMNLASKMGFQILEVAIDGRVGEFDIGVLDRVL
jgi:hypothetical protein